MVFISGTYGKVRITSSPLGLLSHPFFIVLYRVGSAGLGALYKGPSSGKLSKYFPPSIPADVCGFSLCWCCPNGYHDYGFFVEPSSTIKKIEILGHCYGHNRLFKLVSDNHLGFYAVRSVGAILLF